MKRPNQHAKRDFYRLGVGWDRAERDPGDYEGRHRLVEGDKGHQFYMGCPSCLYRVTS